MTAHSPELEHYRGEEIHNVPVKGPNGQRIGTAKVSQGGHVEIDLDRGISGEQIFESLRAGLSDSFSIKPDYRPAIQKQVEEYGFPVVSTNINKENQT